MKVKTVNILQNPLSEQILFAIIVLLNALPVLLFEFFPTMDGPAHLYNSNLINTLLFKGHSDISLYFAINHLPVPNWSGHFILAILNLLFPAYVAEKVLLIVYAFGFPLSFRYFVVTIHPANKSLSYLILPFLYTLLFYLGFYNLCLSFILYFLIIAFWHKNRENLSFPFFVKAFFLFMLMYFTHVLMYAFLCLTILLLEIIPFLNSFINKQLDRKTFLQYTRRYVYILLSASLSLALFYVFKKNAHFFSSGNRLSVDELIRWIKDIRPAIALNYERELRLTEIMYHVYLFLFFITIFLRIQAFPVDKNLSGSGKIRQILMTFFSMKDIWLLLAFISFVLYFVVPDAAGAGMMSDRFCLLFYIMYITWLALQDFPGWVRNMAATAIVILSLFMVNRYIYSTKFLNADAEEIYNAAANIKPNSIVLPVNLSDNWLELHFSNYLGADKPMVIMENYEADVGWFPVKWNDKMLPVTLLGDQRPKNVCLSWRSPEKSEQVRQIDYIMVWGDLKKEYSSCNDSLMKVIRSDYKPVYTSPRHFVKIYERLKNSDNK